MPEKLKYLVIHCTATPEGRDVNAAEILRMHTAPVSVGGLGWKTPGYTDIVRLDGTIERLVANNEDAVVDSWEITNGVKGFNSVCRHIAYVGGCDKNMQPKDTRTVEQKAALAKYLKDFHTKHPGVKIVGHRDLSPDCNGNGKIEPCEWLKACPSFDVSEWLKEIGINQ